MNPDFWKSVPCDPDVAAELAALVRSKRLPPSLLFCGPPGAGKRAAAIAVAQALLCTGGAGERSTGIAERGSRAAEGGGPWPDAPCGSCSACRRVAAGQHPDFKVWEAEGRDVKVEQARALRSATQMRPFEGAVQVHLIPEAERMNEEASNALLKTLEEPTPRAVLILLATAPSLLLPTIRSRCRTLRFPPLGEAAIRERLSAEDGLEAAEASWRARLARGSLVRARALAPDEPQRTARLVEILTDLSATAPPGAIVKTAERWAAETPPERPIERLLEVCRDALLAVEGAGTEELMHPDLQPALARLGASLASRLPAAVERLEAALADLRRPMKPQLLLEEACLHLLGPAA